MSLRTCLPYIQNGFPQQKKTCGCRNSLDYTNLWPILKPIDSMHTVSYALERGEEGIVLGNIEAILCESIFLQHL